MKGGIGKKTIKMIDKLMLFYKLIMIGKSVIYFKHKKKRRSMVKIDTNKCTGCGGCIDLCPVIALSMINDVVTISDELCTGCSICIKVCPMRAPYEAQE